MRQSHIELKLDDDDDEQQSKASGLRANSWAQACWVKSLAAFVLMLTCLRSLKLAPLTQLARELLTFSLLFAVAFFPFVSLSALLLFCNLHLFLLASCFFSLSLASRKLNTRATSSLPLTFLCVCALRGQLAAWHTKQTNARAHWQWDGNESNLCVRVRVGRNWSSKSQVASAVCVWATNELAAVARLKLKAQLWALLTWSHLNLVGFFAKKPTKARVKESERERKRVKERETRRLRWEAEVEAEAEREAGGQETSAQSKRLTLTHTHEACAWYTLLSQVAQLKAACSFLNTKLSLSFRCSFSCSFSNFARLKKPLMIPRAEHQQPAAHSLTRCFLSLVAVVCQLAKGAPDTCC